MICPHADRITKFPCPARGCHAHNPDAMGDRLVTADGRRFVAMVCVTYFGLGQRPAFHWRWVEDRTCR